MKVLNPLLYTLGLSYRGVSTFMGALDAPQDKMTVLRDVQSAGDQATPLLGTESSEVTTVGIDGTGQHLAQPGNPHSEGVVFVVDLTEGNTTYGRLLDVRLTDEKDTDAIGKTMGEIEARYTVEHWVSDEHPSYARIPYERHLLCTAHFKKSKRQRIGDIRDQIIPPSSGGASSRSSNGSSSGSTATLSRWEREQMARGLDVLDRLLDRGGSIGTKSGEKVARIIHERWIAAKAPKGDAKATPQWRMRQLALDLWNNWSRAWHLTNNPTERAIGRTLKIRSKMMRGFKVPRHIPRFAALADFLTAPGETVRLDAFLPT